MACLSAPKWESFYVIVGSAADALTGLQFVVATLIRKACASNNIKQIMCYREAGRPVRAGKGIALSDGKPSNR